MPPPPMSSGVRCPAININLIFCIMEKNIIELFAERVITELKKALAERRKNAKPDEKVDSAMVRFNVVEVLKSLGATYALAGVQVNKDYTWLRVQASKDGFYYPIDFGQRRQATKPELETLKKGIDANDFHLQEAICVAGIHEAGENEVHYSMKWDEFVTSDGEGFAFSGPVRKYHADTKSYDGPVVE